jgi:hypothetical protein
MRFADQLDRTAQAVHDKTSDQYAYGGNPDPCGNFTEIHCLPLVYVCKKKLRTRAFTISGFQIQNPLFNKKSARLAGALNKKKVILLAGFFPF